jgi:hypothetical protein
MIRKRGVHSFWGEVINKLNFFKKKGGAQLSGQTSPHKRMCSHHKASMTVEACFVLPFFLFAFLNVISIMDIFRLQGSMSAVMHSTAKEMAVMAYQYNEVADGTSAAYCLSQGYAIFRANAELGDLYPKSTGWLRSEILKEDECIDLVADYMVKPPISLMGYQNIKLYNRLRTRAWTGFDSAKFSTSVKSTDEEIVYVAETGVVYHKSRACTHIKLSIKPSNFDNIGNERNEYNEKYSSCEACGWKASGTIYITDYGDRYHSSLSCSKLKRTISAIPISQIGSKRPCSRCGGG